jgi:8-oxo-dGTP diphosphatase
MTGRTYPARPIVGIGVCVLRDNAVLLVRRGRPPLLGQWALPGGAQELGETAEAAARRELMEETGINVGVLHLAAVVDSIHPDQGGAIAYHYTIIDFAAHWQEGEPQAGSDVSEVSWAPLDALEPFALRSESHRVITAARDLLAVSPGARSLDET